MKWRWWLAIQKHKAKCMVCIVHNKQAAFIAKCALSCSPKNTTLHIPHQKYFYESRRIVSTSKTGSANNSLYCARMFMSLVLTMRLVMKERGRRRYRTCSKRTHFSRMPKNGQILTAHSEGSLRRQWSRELANLARARSLLTPTVRATDPFPQSSSPPSSPLHRSYTLP